MTLRTRSGFAAMAVLAVIVSGVKTAHAVVQICDVMPERCYYKPDGGWYYTPPPHPVPDFTRTPRNRAVQPSSRGVWGCGATDGKARGRSWSYPNRAAAMYSALSACSRYSPQAKCRIVSCRPSVHSSYEAEAIWGRAHP